MDDLESFQALFNLLIAPAHEDIELYTSYKKPFSLPPITSSILQKLCFHVKNIFQIEPVLLNLKGTFVIVGDIHGHILDLYRIIKKFGLPDHDHNLQYLFLGDIVDRGEFSIESITLIFLMKALWPHNIFLLRGNHEFKTMCTQCGFLTNVIEYYSTYTVFDQFIDVFNYIPLAAILNNNKKILCLHGGIGPNLTTIDQISNLHRPIEEFGNSIIDSILWSDPAPDPRITLYSPSSRGSGFYFGEKALCDFLNSNNVDIIIRGHECISDGISSLFQYHLITVFSASNYCGLVGNKAGTIYCGMDFLNFQTYPPLPYLKKESQDIIASPICKFQIMPDSPSVTFLKVSSTESSLPSLHSIQNANRTHIQKRKDSSKGRPHFDWSILKA